MKPSTIGLVVLLLGGCILLPPQAKAKQPLEIKPTTARMLASFPPKQAFLFAVRPAHWTATRKTLLGLLPKKQNGASLPRYMRPFETILQQKDPKAGMAYMLAMMGIVLGPQQSQPLLKHLDVTHPILHSPFSMDTRKARKVLDTGLFDLKAFKRGATPLSTVMQLTTVPSTNPNGLIKAWSGLIGRFNKPRKDLAKTLGWAGARVYEKGLRLLALIPRKGFVQIVSTKPTPGLALGAKQSWQVLQANDLKLLLKQTQKRPKRPTRAWAHFLKAPSLLAGYGHSANILQSGALLGLHQAYLALKYASPNQRLKLLCQFYSTALAGRYMLSTPAAEFEDTAATLSMTQGVAVQIVSSLTQAGQRAYKASLQDGGKTLATQSKKPLFSFGLNGDLKQLLDAFALPLPWVQAATNGKIPSWLLGHAMVQLRSCGISCRGSLGVSGFWHALKAMLQLMPPQRRALVKAFIPRRAKIVLLGLRAGAKGPPRPTAAAAVLLGPLKPAQQKMLQARAARMVRGWKLTLQPADGGTCALFGLGVDPTKVFGKCKLTQATGSLHTIAVDFKRIAQVARSAFQQLARSGRALPLLGRIMLQGNLLARFQALRGRTRVDSTARVIQLQLVTDTTPKAMPKVQSWPGVAAPRALPQGWPKPGAKMCLRKLQHLSIELAKTIDSATADQKSQLISSYWKRAQPNLACISKDARLKRLVPTFNALWRRARKIK